MCTCTGDIKGGSVYGGIGKGFYAEGGTKQGTTNSASYWLCTSADCSSTCQVEIVDGLIISCL